jgi:hypothetical protein
MVAKVAIKTFISLKTVGVQVGEMRVTALEYCLFSNDNFTNFINNIGYIMMARNDQNM